MFIQYRLLTAAHLPGGSVPMADIVGGPCRAWKRTYWVVRDPGSRIRASSLSGPPHRCLNVKMANDQTALIYYTVPGGQELVQWFGQVPSFHDAEILSLDLRRQGQSALRLHCWSTKIRQDGFWVHDKHAVVTFTLEGVVDLQLDEFNHQNVIHGLILRRAPDRPDRRGYMALGPLPEDIEIEIEPCYGMNGWIRARSVAITLEPGKPGE